MRTAYNLIIFDENHELKKKEFEKLYEKAKIDKKSEYEEAVKNYYENRYILETKEDTNNANDLGTPISLDQMKQSDFAEQLGKDFLYDKEKNLNNGLPALHWHNFNQLIIVKQSNISKVLKARQAYSLRRNTTKNLLNIFFNITDMIDSNLEKGPQ